jgi:asparagine synthetase B (glutamine-hydrolysing)
VPSPDTVTTGIRVAKSGLPVVGSADVLAGFPFGRCSGPRVDRPVPADPRVALRDELGRALQRPPCLVAFSGGRDSSLLLAVAAHLAAEDGHAPPIAHTLLYPGDPFADESSWQQLMVAHLQRRGLAVEWTHTDIGAELDLVGPLLGPVLRRHGGPVFPPALGSTLLLTGLAGGGSLVTGNGGDEVIGTHRSAVLRAALRRRGRGITASDLHTILLSAAPHPLRKLDAGRRCTGHPWLRKPLREHVAALEAAAVANRPLSWSRSVRATQANRAARIGALTRQKVAADNDCELVDPLSSPAFVESWAIHGGRWNGLTRTAAIRFLADGLLPEDIITRRQKAYFNRSRFGPKTQRFASSWDGSGVDADHIDVPRLRNEWLSSFPNAASALLLQHVWLAHGGGAT